MIEAIAASENIRTFSTHILETYPRLDTGKIRRLQRQYWNAFKHLSTKEGLRREDDELLAAFNDTVNDAALFIGWWDYFSVTARLPLPVQVFQLWWFSLNEDKLAPGADLDTIRELFPNMMLQTRTEQKRRLRRAAEKYRHDKAVLQDSRTENNPLCFPAAVFQRT
ncbi:hypothetical protein ABIB85_004467 [Bradyrhizobium sp. JR1.5]|uniref:hypothetical protein n=1 Tax=unclassified Bradyrhizobium TaxID=2631580 RepID=UPI003392CDC5